MLQPSSIKNKTLSTLVTVAVHLLCWATYFLLLSAQGWLLKLPRASFTGSLPYWLPCVAIFYLLAYGILPGFVYRQRYFGALSGILVLLALSVILDYLASLFYITWFPGANPFTLHFYQLRTAKGLAATLGNPGRLLQHCFELAYIIAIPLIVKVSRDMYRLRNHALILQKDNLQLELNFLKAQLNPHFLFNTLNNLDTLITLNQNPQASEVVIRLSQFLRYTLYECTGEFIALSSETQLITDYVSLEKLRHDRVEIDLDIPSSPEALSIPPLLLLPFVENAFKHGVNSGTGESRVLIAMRTKVRSLHFTVENTVPPLPGSPSGGIGLQNVRKRLEHYYPGKHRLDITQTRNLYRVNLVIDL